MNSLRARLMIFCLGSSLTFPLIACLQSPLEETIRIGEVGTMTGSEASYGTGTHRGIVLAIEEINSGGGIHGKKLELISRDDQGKPEETTSAATQLISRHHVLALVGGLPSSRTMAMAPIAQKHQVLLVSPSATNPKVTEFGNFIFRVCFTDPFQGTVLAKFALQNLKFKKIAILRDVKSDYSVGLAEFFRETFTALPGLQTAGEIVIEQSYASGDIDFKSQLTAIRAKKPQAIFIPGYYTEAALIGRQARELGIDIPLLGGDGLDSPKYLEIGGSALNGSYFSTHTSTEDPSDRVQKFISKFKARYGVVPDGLSTLGYDAIQVLANAIAQSTDLKTTTIRDLLAQTQNFQGITGRITLDKERNPLKPVVIMKIQDSKLKYETTILP